MTTKMKTIAKAVIASTLVLGSAAEAGFKNIELVPGQACHGGNYFNGAQLTDYAHTEEFLPPSVFQYWNNFSISEVGALGEFEAQEITNSTPLNTPVVTIYSDSTKNFISSLGLEIDPSLTPDDHFNVPIAEAHTMTSSGPRQQIPTASKNIHKFNPVQNRLDPITVADWNKAKGHALLKCKSNGNGTVRLNASGLVPNGVYTAWQVFAVTNPPNGEEGPIPMTFSPMGGLDNTIVADKHGRATFKRDLTYCPLERENPLMYVSLFLHWDHVLYGTSPVMMDKGMIPGRIGSNHLCFPVGDHL